MNRLIVLLLAFSYVSTSALAADLEITPFRMVNQSPLVQIFGMPADSGAIVTDAGRLTVNLAQDVASNFSNSTIANERVFLDGESYRWTVAARYGIAGRFEAGIDIPYILYGGGFLDGFIEGFHETFGLPRGGRDLSPRNRLRFSYSRDGVRKLNMSQADSGVGDISINGAAKLYDVQNSDSHDRIALRASIKLPTGDSSHLRGSGSTDFSVAICGSMNNFTEWGSLGVFGSVGGMAMTKGDVLPDQQNSLAGFGSAGFGWGPSEWLALKLQLNAHTAMFHGSALDELSKDALMLILGGTLKFPGGYLLDIGVSEDVVVSTSPDVAFHLGLSKQF